MSATKLILLGTLLAAVILVSAGPNSHNFTIGYRLPGDRLVLQQWVEAKSKLWQITTLERSFNGTRYTKITKLEAIDRVTDGTGAYVTLLRGGPGYQNATLRFKSQRNHGIHFIVNLYAR